MATENAPSVPELRVEEGREVDSTHPEPRCSSKENLRNSVLIPLRDRASPTTISNMKQLGRGLNLSARKTRKREFLEEMEARH